jgi:hypothetical protein
MSISATGIIINYNFVNNTASDVYIFSTLFHVSLEGHRRHDPDLVYVIPGDPGKAVVGKFLFAIPAGMAVEAPEIPYLSVVHSGVTLSGRGVVPVPLRLYTPYLEPDGADPGESGKTTRLTFRLGVLDSAKFPPFAPVVEPAPPPPPNSFICDYGFGILLQRFFDVELTLPEPAPEHFRR